MSEGSEKLLGVSVGGEGGRGGEEEVSRAEAAFSIKMPTSPHCSSRRRRRRRRRARYVHNVAGPREPHAAAFIRFPVFIAPRPFLPTCTLLPSTDPISVPTVTVFSLPFFFLFYYHPRILPTLELRGSWGPWSLFIGDVHGHLDAFLGEILNSLASLPSLFVFVVFILFLFFFFLFLWALFFGFNEEEREKGVFWSFLFFFFFFWIRGRMNRCRSRDWERKRIFGFVGIHGKAEYG